MGEINFVSDSKKKREHHNAQRDVEYSSGQVVPEQVSAPVLVTEKKESSFAAWRKRREEEKAAKAREKQAEQQIPSYREPKKKHEPANAHPGIELIDDNSPNLIDNLLSAQDLHREKLEYTEPSVVQPHTLVVPDVTPVVEKKQSVPPQQEIPKKRSSAKKISHPKHKSSKKEDEQSQVPLAQKKRETVNLIPNTVLEELHRRNRLRDLGYNAIGLVGIVFLVFGALNLYQQKISVDTRVTEEAISDIEQQITQFQFVQQEALYTNDRLIGVDTVLNNHVYWTPLLEELERITLPTVYYYTMAGSATTRQFTLGAYTTDYSFIEPQVRLMRESDLIEQVNVSSATASQVVVNEKEGVVAKGEISETQTLVSFTMTVTFTPEVFQYHTRTQ